MIHSLCPCSHAGWNTYGDHAGLMGQSDRTVPNYATYKACVPPIHTARGLKGVRGPDKKMFTDDPQGSAGWFSVVCFHPDLFPILSQEVWQIWTETWQLLAETRVMKVKMQPFLVCLPFY